MNRVSLDMMSVQANTGPPWPEKNATAFWRGRDSRQERLELVKLSRAHPNMIDAAFTNFFFFKHDESLYGPLVKHVSFFDFFKVRKAIEDISEQAKLFKSREQVFFPQEMMDQTSAQGPVNTGPFVHYLGCQ